MNAPLDLLPLALCGLATIVGVAVVLVLSDLVRRFVLFIISALLPAESPTSRRAEAPSRVTRDARSDPGGTALPR